MLNLPINKFENISYIASYDEYIKHETSCSDHIMQKMFSVNVNSQLNFLEKMKTKMILKNVKPHFKLIEKKILAIEDSAFGIQCKQKIFMEIQKQFKDNSKLFISNKILPFSHPVRRRIFNKIKLAFNISLKPTSYKKNRASNLHHDELLKILTWRNDNE